MCVVRQGLLTFSFSVRCGRPLFILYTSGTSYIQFLSQMWEASIHIVYVRDFLHSVSQSDVGGLYSYCTQPTASSLVEVTDGIRSTSGSIRIKT
jgi:hypothetical protein